MNRFNKQAFTLIELIVVIVVIGVLASISAPMMQGAKVRAVCAEAVSALGTIRSALRTYYSAYGDYPAAIKTGALVWLIDHPDEMMGIGIPIDNLQGLYFGKECYAVNLSDNPNDCGVTAVTNPLEIVPSGQANTAPKGGELDPMIDGAYKGKRFGVIAMYVRDGRIIQLNISKSGYPSGS